MIQEKRLAALEKRVKELEEQVQQMSGLGARLEQLAAAQNEMKRKLPDIDPINQELAKQRDGLRRALEKATAVEARIPQLRQEIEKYYRDANFGIIVAVGVLIVIIVVAGFLS